MSKQTFNARFTQAQRKVIAELMPILADRLILTSANQRTLAFALDELQSIQQKAQESICHAETGMKRNSLRHIIDATATMINEIVPKDGNRFAFVYEYDFGDGWSHEVLFEGCLRAEKGRGYPLCIEGGRSCPPEDVGGVWGYAEFLDAIANPKHEQHEEFKEWAGPFDSETFDAAKLTKKMRRGLPDWRRYEYE